MASLTTRQIAAADFSHDLSVEHSQSVDKRTSFDGVTLTFHWVTVMLVLGLFTTAIWHALSHDDVLRVMLLRIHRSLGVTVWMTTALRLIWRKTNAELPPFPEGMSQLHRALSGWTELAVCRLAAPGKRTHGGNVRPTRIFCSAASVRLVFVEERHQLLRYIGSQRHAGAIGRLRTDQ